MTSSETSNVKKISGIASFFREVKNELKKVTWPTKKQLIAYTFVVFVTVLMITTLIWIIDTIFSVAFRWILQG